MPSFTDVTTLPAGSFDQYEDKGNLAQLILDGAQGYLNYKKGESDKKAATEKAAEAEARKRSLEDKKLSLEERRVASTEAKNKATIASLTGTKKSDKIKNLKAITAALEKYKSDSLSKLKSLTDEKNAVSKTMEFGASEQAVMAGKEKISAIDSQIADLRANLEANSKEWDIANREYINALKGVEKIEKNPKATPAEKKAAKKKVTEAEKVVKTIAANTQQGLNAGDGRSPILPVDGTIRDEGVDPEQARQGGSTGAGVLNRIRGTITDDGVPFDESQDPIFYNPTKGTQIPEKKRGRKPLSVDSLVGDKAETGGLTKDEFRSLPPMHQNMMGLLNKARSRRKNRGL